MAVAMTKMGQSTSQLRANTLHRPIVFVDFDDVLVLNQQYGGYDVICPNPPEALWQALFNQAATKLLREVIAEFNCEVVLTTSWLRFLDRAGFDQLFARTGQQFLAASLHTQWDAPQNRGESRRDAIARWLSANHRCEPFVVLDDTVSGTGLARSDIDIDGRVILCEENVGLLPRHLAAIRAALLTSPPSRQCTAQKN
jgi:hypothetical protein